MSAFAATAWTFGITFGLFSLAALAISVRGGGNIDLVTVVLIQLVVYSTGLFAILRLHAPNASIRQFLGLRGTSFAAYPLALALGLALSPATNKLFELIRARYPLEHEEKAQAILDQASDTHRLIFVVFLVLIGPIVEEAVFRGALFAPLRRHDWSSPWGTVGVTSVLFVMVHLTWQKFPLLLVVAVVLGVLRWKTGSIIPAMLLHIGYNSAPVLLTMTSNDVEVMPLSWALAGGAASPLLLAMILLSCYGPRAAAARDEEL
jgi:membrane protease YdiL (CAAX protease family)